MFKVGDIIRNKNPYFGEGTEEIVKIDEHFIYSKQGNSKFGRWDRYKYDCLIVIYKHNMKHFRKAYLYERFYLLVLGNIVSIWRKVNG